MENLNRLALLEEAFFEISSLVEDIELGHKVAKSMVIFSIKKQIKLLEYLIEQKDIIIKDLKLNNGYSDYIKQLENTFQIQKTHLQTRIQEYKHLLEKVELTTV